MKNEKNMELFKNLEMKKDFKVFLDSVDFGVYKYNKEKNIYQGEIGYVTLESMLKAIKDKTYFLQVELVER